MDWAWWGASERPFRAMLWPLGTAAAATLVLAAFASSGNPYVNSAHPMSGLGLLWVFVTTVAITAAAGRIAAAGQKVLSVAFATTWLLLAYLLWVPYHECMIVECHRARETALWFPIAIAVLVAFLPLAWTYRAGRIDSRPMDNRRLVRVLSAWLLVPISSFTGLVLPMGDYGIWVLIQTWRANFWGDLIFVGGTVGATWATWRLLHARRHHRLGAPAFAFLMHWAVYALAFSTQMAGGAPWHFLPWPVPSVWRFVLVHGWPGLLASALWVPLWTLWDGRTGVHWLRGRDALPA